MICSIMQPYLFPYLGYFQLIAASDVFVIHDDVQYIKGGWINRNRILVNGRPEWWTLPVAWAPHDREIRDREYRLDSDTCASLLRRLQAAYRGAANYATAIELVEDILMSPEHNVALFNGRALAAVASVLSIPTRILTSSLMRKNSESRGVGRVLDICASVGAKAYLNPDGGRDLYEPATFERRGLTLNFIEHVPRIYPQFAASFVPCLSIIDVLMHNEFTTVRGMLEDFRIGASDPCE